MNTVFTRLALAGLVMLSAGAASAAVTVTFTHAAELPRHAVRAEGPRAKCCSDLSDHFA